MCVVLRRLAPDDKRCQIWVKWSVSGSVVSLQSDYGTAKCGSKNLVSWSQDQRCRPRQVETVL